MSLIARRVQLPLAFALLLASTLACGPSEPTASTKPSAPTEPSEPSALQRSLAFELDQPDDGPPTDWGGGPEDTLFADGEVVHGGEWSARIERTDESAGGFSSLTRSLPVDFGGEVIELRAWLRSDAVDGTAGLWMREDSAAGSVEFDNMSDRPIAGTTEWTLYSIELPLDEAAREVYFGALLAGTGKVWVDDFELLVDGAPVELAPRVEHEPTILDTDTEFRAGSGVELSALSPVQTESLTVLAKVWGFLKYHDPRVAAGQLHWDFELFRALPPVLAAKDAAQRNAAILAWVQGMGEVPSCQTCARAPADSELHLPPRIGWIHDQALLGPELAQALALVHRNRPATGEHFWIGQHPGVGNADFSMEPSYPDLDQLDAGYRILAALRLWNIIEYWFPYRDMIEESWDDVLRELLPVFVAAEGREAYQLALLALIARVHDTHANIWSALEVRPPVGACGLPVEARFLAKELVITQVHGGPEHPLRVGDLVLTLDGKPVEDLVAAWSPVYAASNEPTRRRDIARMFSRGACGPLKLAVKRGRKRVELELERVKGWDAKARRWHDRPGETFERLGPDVAYLKLSTITSEDIPAHVEAALGTRGLIIDIRNYPSAFTVFDLGQHLVDEATPFARFTTPDLANPGAFTWTPSVELTPQEPTYAGKIVILVDEVSQSSAEYTTMAFRAAPGAIVIGSTTAAADGNVSPIPLPGKERTLISGIGVFYPDKRPTQRVGIVPDISVVPTREGIADGRDELLERALREILGPKVPAAKLRELAAVPAPRETP